jgi:hypothetical protein
VCAGGSVNWAWTRDKLGEPWWVDLSNEVGNWTDASDIDPLDVLAWTAPAAASMRSFPAQFVAAVLALGTNVARPSTALMSTTAFNDECLIGWSARAARKLSDARLLSSCVLTSSFRSSKEEASAESAKSVSELVEWDSKDIDRCRDVLGLPYVPFYEAVAMATLAQALPATGSCAGGCPLSRPLCNGALGCVRPTCAHVKSLCNENTNAGALARFFCSVTCGCDDLTSDLLWIGLNSGCLPKCKEAAKAAANETCSDAQPGSAELAALVGYSRAVELRLTGQSVTDASTRSKLGCFAVNFDAKWILCDPEFWNIEYGAKSLLPFCPVSCGCIGDPSKPGCPRACSAPEPPTLRDLSDAQLAEANAAMASWNQSLPRSHSRPYPPSCSGLHATDCDALRTTWHKHPCPVACGIDPTAPSTRSETPFALTHDVPCATVQAVCTVEHPQPCMIMRRRVVP